MSTETAAIVLLYAAGGASCFVAAMRRPGATRIAGAVVVALVAGSALTFSIVLFVEAESPDNAGSFGPGLAASFLFLAGIFVAVFAFLAWRGGEVGRWIVVAVAGYVGRYAIQSTLAEPLRDDAVAGSIILILLSLGAVAVVTLLAGGSDAVGRWSGRLGPRPDPSGPGFLLRP